MAERRKPDADGNTGDVTAKPFVRLVRDQEREFYPICHEEAAGPHWVTGFSRYSSRSLLQIITAFDT